MYISVPYIESDLTRLSKAVETFAVKSVTDTNAHVKNHIEVCIRNENAFR